MIKLIIKAIIIFVIVNLIEFLILFVFKVNRQIVFNFILNNILGMVGLIIINYFKIFPIEINILSLLIVSSTGTIGLLGILLNTLIPFRI